MRKLENNKLIKNTTSYLFNKKINNNSKFIIFHSRENKEGNFKYFPPISKEWKNSIYSFNAHNIQNFPVYDFNLNNLIKSYFNSSFFFKFLFSKFKTQRFKRLSLNKVYTSKPEINHTSSKAIITIYVYNRERLLLLRKVKELRKNFFKRILLIFNKNSNYYLKKILLSFNSNNNNYYKEVLLLFHKHYSGLCTTITKFFLYKELLLIRRYKLKLSLNKYRFEEKFLSILAKFIGKFYNKKIEFNIVNLKSLILNSDIFTKIISLKLKKKNFNTVRILNFILNKAKLPRVNRIKERSRLTKSINFHLLDNKYKDLDLSSLVQNTFDLLLNKSYFNVNNNNIKLYDIIFNSINYKNMGGIRLEIKGRLTKRYRADRSKFQVKLKGGLKNIDSSFKGLSSVNKRGYFKSNVEYSMFVSKRRIGAFAAKGWISGK